jgi:hypothetical protein
MSDREPAQTAKPSPRQVVSQAQAAEPVEASFADVAGPIEQARQRAHVNGVTSADTIACAQSGCD